MADAVAVRSSRLVVNRTFTLRSVDMRAHFIVDHCCINLFICVLNFHGWENFTDLWYFCMGSYKYSMVAVINVGAYIHGCLANYRKFIVIRKIRV